MLLYIVRHGETDRNRYGISMGHDEVPLNAKGNDEANRIAKYLATYRIDVIYCSDLLRARQTAQVIKVRHPYVRFVVDPALRERDSGVFAVQPIAEREIAWRASGLGYRDWKPAGGESLREVKRRAGRWYARHRVLDAGKSVVVVTHGLFIYALLELAIYAGDDIEDSRLSHANGAITILDVPLVGPTYVERLNDRQHLSSKVCRVWKAASRHMERCRALRKRATGIAARQGDTQ